VLPSHAKELDTTDGTDAEVSDSNTEVNLSVGDIAHHGFAGTPVLIDPASKTDSPCNWQIRQNNGAESHWYETGVGRLGTVDTNEAGLTKLNAWLAAQGIKEVYMLDNSRTAKNESTFPYLIGTPRIYAYLCDSEHKNIRIVGTLNSAKYKKVGFNYNVKVNGVAEIHATDHWTTTAYTDVGLKTANQLNGEYLYEMTLLNVPTDKTVVVSIVPKALAISGQEYVGQRYNLTFTNGKFTKCQITNP